MRPPGLYVKKGVLNKLHSLTTNSNICGIIIFLFLFMGDNKDCTIS